MNMPINSLIMIVAVLIVVKECFKFFCNLSEFKVIVKKKMLFLYCQMSRFVILLLMYGLSTALLEAMRPFSREGSLSCLTW